VASSWVAIAGGLSIGREGPLIEVGGALGAAVGRAVQTSLNHTRVLVGAGTAAGFAAAYNTPFAASLFVLETIAGIAAPELLLPVMAATVGAAGIMRATVGAGPIYGQRAFGLTSYAELFSFALLGIAAALVAAAFKTVLAILERWFDTHPVPQPFRATLGGLLVGAIAMWLPAVVGNGYEPLNRILDSGITVTAVIVLVIAKMIATSGYVESSRRCCWWVRRWGQAGPASRALVLLPTPAATRSSAWLPPQLQVSTHRSQPPSWYSSWQGTI
jgi:CIC family chloride channel protein